MTTWWEAINFNLANIVAGFSGGVVNAFVFRRSDPYSIIGSVIVGALTANYLGGAAAKALSALPFLNGTAEHVAAFLVGMLGMGFAQGIIEVINKKFRSVAGSHPDESP